jgi:hypothetical protein
MYTNQFSAFMAFLKARHPQAGEKLLEYCAKQQICLNLNDVEKIYEYIVKSRKET